MRNTELRESMTYLEEKAKRQVEAKKLSMKAEADRKKDAEDKRDSIKAKFEEKAKKFGQFKDNIKKKLVREALENLVIESINNPSQREINLCEAIVDQYVDDIGVEAILRRMRSSNNEILECVYTNIAASYKAITEEADPEDPNTQVMDKESLDDFWKNVTDSTDVDDATNIIRLRVANAEEEFVNRNLRDKENIETIMKDTAERVQAAKSSNDNDYSDDVEEAAIRDAKRKIHEAQHKGRRNVFGRMVISLGETAMKKESLRKEFVTEAGRLDTEKVVETVRCMYTVLEALSSLNLEKVDEKYIKETLESMDK